MKKLKRISSLILASVLVGGLSACGGSAESAAPAAEPVAPAAEAPAAAPAEEAPAAETPAEEPAAETEASEPAEEITLRMSWWGANTRNERMNEILDIYQEKNPGVVISREYTSWGDYWTKFTTQASAGTQPDVAPFVMQSIQEYVNKGVLLPLDEYADSGAINISDWSQAAISPGVINGKLYGVTFALTSQGVLYNEKIITDAGMSPPPENWTVEQYKAYCLELQPKLPEGVYAVEATAYDGHAIESFMRSKGKSIYSTDGTALGFEREDLTEWFTLWEELRQAGCMPEAALSAELFQAPYEQTLFGSNRAAMIFQNGNLVPTFQNLANGPVKMAREPRVNADIPGEFFQPTALGVSSKSTLVDESVKLIDYLVNDIDANLIFKADYGAPGDPDVLTALRGIATDAENLNYDFVELLLNDANLPPTTARAEGSTDVLDVLLKLVVEDVSSEAVTIEEGVDRFFNEATAILSQNTPNG